ncbi:MAG: stage II sporulation protein R, partial [Paenibacillus sp. RIFOXYA1_FULL_44_5]
MIKRTSYRSYLFILFAIFIMMMSWDETKANASILDQKIPQESIRLRILANSDSPEDQWIKRKVRDAVIQEVNEWVSQPQGIEQARQMISQHIPQINQIVAQVLHDNGFAYSYQSELGIVPFPAKIYGNEVYPAGNYEALRVTLGEGKGQNWWCVLFPPLCFVDAVSG